MVRLLQGILFLMSFQIITVLLSDDRVTDAYRIAEHAKRLAHNAFPSHA